MYLNPVAAVINHTLYADVIQCHVSGKYYVWLSGTDEDGHWMWPDSNQEFTYTNWGDDQPDNEGRYHQDAHCLALRTQNFKWDDLACNEESNYVCVFK